MCIYKILDVFLTEAIVQCSRVVVCCFLPWCSKTPHLSDGVNTAIAAYLTTV